jgi:hypothetical protein
MLRGHRDDLEVATCDIEPDRPGIPAVCDQRYGANPRPSGSIANLISRCS